MDSRMRPREIQARVRAGQSLDEVARAAGIPIDRVLRYAGPILHEREHIAQEAAKANVRRDDHGAVMLLGELVADRLEELGVPRDGMEWDAWRRDDGGWEVRLDYLAGDTKRSALWVYDPLRRTVTPDDDDARWLLAEEPAASVTKLRSVTRAKKTPVADAKEAPGAPVDDTTAAPAAPAPTEPAPVTPPRSARDKAIDAATLAQKHTVPDTPPSRKKRASVPSWDEILLGSRKPE
jgi:hypothetical protein